MTQTVKSGWSATRRNATRRRLVGLGLVLALAAAVAAIPAVGGHVPPDGPEVTPTVIAGNPNCGTIGVPGTFEIKVEPVADGTFTFTGTPFGTVTVTLDVNEGAKSFTFDLSDNVLAKVVLVKGGPAANMYDYSGQPGGGINHDDGLIAPNNLGLSHISFCLIRANTALTIDKEAVADPITVGDKFAYDITISDNANGVDAINATITDTLVPNGFNWEIVSQSGSACSISDSDSDTFSDDLSCTFATLADGTSYSVRVRTLTAVPLGSSLCGNTFTNTANADADNAEPVSDSDSITVACGAIQVNKSVKVPGNGTQPLQGAGFTLLSGGSAVNPPGEVTTDANGVACFDGLPVNTQFTLRETTVPTGYAGADDQLVTSSAANADCEGTGTPTSVNVSNDPLTDVSIDVTAQVPGATLSTIDCGTAGSALTPADPASLDITGLEPGTYVCTIVIDP